MKIKELALGTLSRILRYAGIEPSTAPLMTAQSSKVSLSETNRITFSSTILTPTKMQRSSSPNSTAFQDLQPPHSTTAEAAKTKARRHKRLSNPMPK